VTSIQMYEGDKLIECVGCKVVFLFSVGEAAFFKDHDLDEPKRCAPCRHVRREEKERIAADTPAEGEEVGDCGV